MNTNPPNAVPNALSRELLPPRLGPYSFVQRFPGAPASAWPQALNVLRSNQPEQASSARLLRVDISPVVSAQVAFIWATPDIIQYGEPMGPNNIPNSTGAAATPYALGSFCSAVQTFNTQLTAAYEDLGNAIRAELPEEFWSQYAVAFMNVVPSAPNTWQAWAVWYPCLADATTPPALAVSVNLSGVVTTYDRVIDRASVALRNGRPIFEGSGLLVQRENLGPDGIRWKIEHPSGPFVADAAFYLNPWDVQKWLLGDANGAPALVTLQPIY